MYVGRYFKNERYLYILIKQYNGLINNVKSIDALLQLDNAEDAFTIFRYSDNNISAGVAYKGAYRTVSLGFPIETLATPCQIEKLMGEVLNFFEK